MIQIYSYNKKAKVNLVYKDCVNLYVCGPTVYDKIHIGNARTFVFFDIVFRFLQFFYQNVNYVRNITDLDDKIEQKSIDLNIPSDLIVSDNIAHFHGDLKYLNCLSPTHEPKATDYISNIIIMIQTLVNNDFAYQVGGNVYFDISKYKNYYNVFQNIIKENNDFQTDINIDARVKRNSKDFILWKSIEDKHEKRIYQNGFDSPFGKGRPGWHIECSAMSIAHFHDRIDIHGGGVDLKFPHHVNEVCQSQSYMPSFKVHHWIHVAQVSVHGKKMSKSLNNVVTIDELKQKYSSDAIRFFLLNNNHKNSIDFSYQALHEAENYINSIFLYCYGEMNIGSISQEFLDIISDDFNIALIFNRINEHINNKSTLINAKSVLAIFKLLGFKFIQDVYEDRIDDDILSLVESRDKDRQNNDWHKADKKKYLIEQKGYIIFDLPDRTVLRHK